MQDTTASDHTMLKLTTDMESVIHKNRDNSFQYRSKTKKSKTIILEETTEEQWDKYKQKIESKLKTQKTKQQIIDTQNNPNVFTQEKIQYYWEEFKRLIIRTAFNHLHCHQQKRRVESRNINHKKKYKKSSPFFNDYHKAIKIKKRWKDIETIQKRHTEEEIWKDLKWIEGKTGVINSLPTNPIDFNPPESIEEWTNIKAQIDMAIQFLKKTSYKEEKKRMNKEIKEAIQKRCSDLQTNQRRTIQALTNSFRDKIIIDRLKIMETETKEYISTEKEEIFRQAEEYYKKVFRKRNPGFEQLNEAWKEQYQPHEYIQEEWYTPLENKISLEELETTINLLPNNKAAGLSGIKYEMLKQLGEEGKLVLVELFNLFIIKGQTLLSWKESLLYPISKGKEWHCELKNTRPIVLLEATRKCFTKILTDRLENICKRNNILKGPNFAGLPGESTMEPIHLLNNICEEARETDKELWILF